MTATTHMTPIELDGGVWWVPWTSTTAGVTVYPVAIMGESGARALARVIGGQEGTEGEIADHEGFLAALERACDEDGCLGHQVRRLRPEQVAQLASQIRTRQARLH